MMAQATCMRRYSYRNTISAGGSCFQPFNEQQIYVSCNNSSTNVRSVGPFSVTLKAIFLIVFGRYVRIQMHILWPEQTLMSERSICLNNKRFACRLEYYPVCYIILKCTELKFR